MRRFTDQKYYLYLLIAGLLIIPLIIVLGSSTYRGRIYQVLASMKLVPLPESFTELYITNHTELPATIKSYVPIQFSFTIHNQENKTMQYPYEVYLVVDGKKYVIDTKKVSLSNNVYKTIRESFLVTTAPSHSKVVVMLPNKQQSIDFWLSQAL